MSAISQTMSIGIANYAISWSKYQIQISRHAQAKTFNRKYGLIQNLSHQQIKAISMLKRLSIMRCFAIGLPKTPWKNYQLNKKIE